MKTCRFHFFIRTAFLLAALLNVPPVSAQSFKKAYKRFYQKQDYPAADAVFEKYKNHRVYASAARYYLAKNRLRTERSLPSLLLINTDLNRADSIYRVLSSRRAKRLTRKYGVDTLRMNELRLDAQRWAMAGVRATGTITALDSLIDYWERALPALQPELDATHSQIVNARLGSEDYDEMTDIMHRHLAYVLPANYRLSRQLYDRLWSAFQDKYSLCDIHRFAADHPQTFVARDCWRKEVEDLLCQGSLEQLLDFELNNRWTALEIQVINAIMNQVAADPVVTLPVKQSILLQDLQKRSALRELLRTGRARRDTAATLQDALHYITTYAPRYSAFRLLEETMQFFLEEEFYASSIELLRAARPFFSDTLPAFCPSNFDYQLRVKPYIDGVLPILEKNDPEIKETYLNDINTEEGDEFSPVLNATQTTLYFGASGLGSNIGFTDVFVSFREQDKWSQPLPVYPLCKSENQIPLSLTADEKTMLLLVDGKLNMSICEQGRWANPQPVSLEGIPFIGKAVLSADGQMMILEGAYSTGSVLNAPDMDLFISFRDSDGRWSDPQALGSDINTDGDEGNPFFAADGKTLYFTSTGYPGLGKSDLFVSHRTGPDWAMDWSRPQNLGKKINNVYAHKGWGFVTPDGQTAYFARYTRDGQKGNIWLLEMKN